MSSVTTISREALRTELEAGSIVALDAQGHGWYERERLPGAIRGRPQDLAELENCLPQGKDTRIAVYCWSDTCVGSDLTAHYLVALGYSDVRRYVGGKRDWIAAGLPVERGSTSRATLGA